MKLFFIYLWRYGLIDTFKDLYVRKVWKNKALKRERKKDAQSKK